MNYPQDQIDELNVICPGSRRHDEGGVTYFYLPGLQLPAGCNPDTLDALLCPTPHHGYTSRLLFEQQFSSPQSRNWHYTARVAERNWQAISWNIPEPNMRLAQLLACHLRAFR